MKIFISWSGKRSRIIAEGLNSWLPNVIQSIETFFSPEIEKGTKGGAEINVTLEGTSFGIICLTPDNLNSTWIHYEAGALAKIEGSNTRIWTLLNGLSHSDVAQPLAQFQHTLTEKEDIYRLLESINKHLEKPLTEASLRKTFEVWWSELESKINDAEKLISKPKENDNQKAKNIRSDREILDEVLELLRAQERNRYKPFDNSIQNLKDVKFTTKNISITGLNCQLTSSDETLLMSGKEIDDALQSYFEFSTLSRSSKEHKGLIYHLSFNRPRTAEEINDCIAKFTHKTGIKVEIISYDYDLL